MSDPALHQPSSQALSPHRVGNGKLDDLELALSVRHDRTRAYHIAVMQRHENLATRQEDMRFRVRELFLVRRFIEIVRHEPLAVELGEPGSGRKAVISAVIGGRSVAPGLLTGRSPAPVCSYGRRTG